MAEWIAAEKAKAGLRHAAVSRSTIGGGRGCNKFVPVFGGDGTRIAPSGDLFDQPPREMS